MECHCPISHIPLAELRMAVVFRGDTKTVYDAEHLVHWLKAYVPRNPMTNVMVHAGARIVDVLIPFQLPHMSESDLRATELFLRRNGRVWWSSPSTFSGNWKDGFGVCMCLIVWASGFYGLLFLAECLVDTDVDFACLMAPVVLSFVQLSCIISLCWMFPDIRAQLALWQAICLTLGCVASAQMCFWLVHLYATPEELCHSATHLLLRHRGWAQFLVHPRVMALLEKILIV
jgi:hypothetical protein